MGYIERTVWTQLAASGIGFATYAALVVPQLLSRPLADVAWILPMIATILGAIVLSIAASIAWGIAAGMRDPEGAGGSDQRDREIAGFGHRVGQAFLVLGGLAGLGLAMVDAAPFWIANVIFLGFFLSAAAGGLARLGAYRRGIA